MPLSQDDLVLGRAVVSWGMIQLDQLMLAVEEMGRLSAIRQPMTLAQVLIGWNWLSADRYQAIVARLRQEFMHPNAPQSVQQAAARMPNINASGSYTTQQQVPHPSALESSGIERAVQGWGIAATQITAPPLRGGATARMPPQAGGYPPAHLAGSTPPAHMTGSGPHAQNMSGSGPHGQNMSGSGPHAAQQPPAQQKRKGPPSPDDFVRKKLKVPEGQDRFPIGPWIVEQYIAAGNWGIVYRVSRQGVTNPYALKLLKPMQAGGLSEQVRKRFIREARTMYKLKHPGIAHVHDAGEAGGLLWFVMDFCEGPTLKEIVEEEEGEGLGVPEAVRVVGKLCTAVAYAHSQGILHRDLKPENVIMVGSREPVLTDFGLAKDEGSDSMLTQEGQRLGTPLFMAPELLLGSDSASELTEVYSLGAILYQALSGQVPYKAKTMRKLIEAIEKGKATPLRKLCSDVPKGLDKLCMRALHSKPDKRPQTADDLGQELAAFG